MKKTLVLLVAGMMAAGSAFAQETPGWIRKNAISPDGSEIAFCYKGDIFVVSKEGGRAIQITSHPTYDSNPLWTNDGKNIVFSSERDGAADLYITSKEGGVPKRIETFGGNKKPLTILPDGRIVFAAAVLQDVNYGGFPNGAQLYTVGLEGQKPEMMTSMKLRSISFNQKGVAIYEDLKGFEDPFRKHHTSSVTRDIMLYQPSAEDQGAVITGNGKFSKLSDYEGEDTNPVFGSDGDTFYYLSERDGKTSNVYQSSISNPSKNVQLTFAEKNPVRYLSISDNDILSFSYDGGLYTLTPGQNAKKVEVELMRDPYEPELVKWNLSRGATDMALAPDSKQIAVIMRGDVYVASPEFGTTKRITNTATQERDLCFSEDGRTLYYSAERNGNWGIYRSTLTDKDDKTFIYAHEFKEELFSLPGETSFQPQVAPNGKFVVYLRDRNELVMKEVKSDKVTSLLKNGAYSYTDGDLSFEISPDSRWVLYTYHGEGGWNNADVALIEIETGKCINLTQSGYSIGNFKWVLGGKAVAYESDKEGFRSHGSWGADTDVFMMFLDGKALTEFRQDKEDIAVAKMLEGKSEKQIKKEEAKEKKDSLKNKVPELKLDLENRFERIVRLTPSSASLGDFFINNNATQLYYMAPTGEQGYALYKRDLKKGNISVMLKGVYGRIYPSKDGNTIYVLSGRGIQSINLMGGQPKPVSFNGEFDYRPNEERAYMFDHVWKQVQEKFYDPEIHGVDWEYYRDHYRQFLPYISNNADFAELLSEMLGELNGSHTGARSYGRSSKFNSFLGFFEDNDYKGDGVKIKEVIVNGPLNLADSELKEGDLIVSINGHKIVAGENWRKLLINKAGQKMFVTVKKGKKTEELYLEPVNNLSDLLYRRWVKQREDMVERLSGGRVGYVHVEGMDSPSFREVYSKALGKYRGAEALIVDIRHNGGGFLHDDLATLLNGQAYLKFQPRGQYISTEPYSKWTKPSCVLMCEEDYSDASGFPYVYQTLGIGKLIGAPVAGTMTAVWWERLINPMIVFGIPQVGAWGLKEQRYLENLQVEPDILVYNDAASDLNGKDVQLEAAVKEMLKTIDQK